MILTLFDQPGVAAVGLWTGIHLLLTLALAINVTRLRFASARGDIDDATLERGVRAHGNNIEYVPFALFALFVLAQQGYSGLWIHTLAGALFIGRICHAHGIQQSGPGLPPTRVAGNVVTWAVFAISALMLISGFFF